MRGLIPKTVLKMRRVRSIANQSYANLSNLLPKLTIKNSPLFLSLSTTKKLLMLLNAFKCF